MDEGNKNGNKGRAVEVLLFPKGNEVKDEMTLFRGLSHLIEWLAPTMLLS